MARGFQQQPDFFLSVYIRLAAVPEHLPYEHAISRGRPGGGSRPAQALGKNSAELNALEFRCGGRRHLRVLTNQLGKRLLSRANPPLQEAVEVEEPVPRGISKAQRPHALHVFAHRRSQMTAVARQRLQGFQRFFRPRLRHGPQNGGG